MNPALLRERVGIYMSELISVIVPVYNSMQTIDSCVDSIVNQTYGNIEIILIDDGSTDESSNLCDLWAENDSRVLVVHQRNGGVSAARNHGIEMSHGEYLAFVDPDDFIEQDYLDNARDFAHFGLALG